MMNSPGRSTSICALSLGVVFLGAARVSSERQRACMHGQRTATLETRTGTRQARHSGRQDKETQQCGTEEQWSTGTCRRLQGKCVCGGLQRVLERSLVGGQDPCACAAGGGGLQ
jgi:hypothetical protein